MKAIEEAEGRLTKAGGLSNGGFTPDFSSPPDFRPALPLRTLHIPSGGGWQGPDRH